MATHLRDHITVVRGEGSTVWDEHGKAYLHAASGLWNVSCGYGHPRILAAVIDQLQRLPYGTLFRFSNQPARELARRLVELAPAPLSRVFLTTSGASAVETALKLARAHAAWRRQPQRRLIAAFRDSYHGTTYGSMAVSGESLGQIFYGVDQRDVSFLPTPGRTPCAACAGPRDCSTDCVDALDDLCTRAGDRLAGVICEPILGSAGVIEPPARFWDRLAAWRDRLGFLIIIDEVATGVGRTGSMLESERLPFVPDFIALSKGLNSGYLPVGATIVAEHVWAPYANEGVLFAHGETQAGNPACCAAAIATLDVIADEHLIDAAAHRGEQLAAGLRNLLDHPSVAAVTGRGLMCGVHLNPARHPERDPTRQQVAAVCDAFLDHGVIVHPSPRGFSLFPPLVITADEVDRIIEAAGAVVAGLDLA